MAWRELRSKAIGVGMGAACVWASATAQAGDLAPPSGSVGPTMKTLATVEPRTPVGPATTPGDATALYVIGAPGSYYLTGNVLGASGKSGIRIDASGVTLDLGGFQLKGVPGASDGVLTGVVTALVLRNGTILDWPGRGANLDGAMYSRVEELTAQANGSIGISVGSGSMVRDCTSEQNTGHGFSVNGRATFTHCLAASNLQSGFSGIGTFADCESEYNAASGFVVSSGSASGCYARANSDSGFVVDDATVSSCTAVFNVVGFFVGAPASLSHCVAKYSLDDGFHLTGAARLDSCVAQENTEDGFQLASGSHVSECASSDNQYGFYNPQASPDARIEGCSASGNSQYGFLVLGAGTLVVRNSASSNLNGDYVVDGVARSGPFINAVGTITSTSPWANFGNTSLAADTTRSNALIAAKELAASREAERRASEPAPDDWPTPPQGGPAQTGR